MLRIHFNSNLEVARKRQAVKHGLPEDATWEQINKIDLEVARKRQAAEFDLEKDATWEQIKNIKFKK
ncbi:MAG: hypothetical protein AAB526_02290 [Patescibacteria group bacterium]